MGKKVLNPKINLLWPLTNSFTFAMTLVVSVISFASKKYSQLGHDTTLAIERERDKNYKWAKTTGTKTITTRIKTVVGTKTVHGPKL